MIWWQIIAILIAVCKINAQDLSLGDKCSNGDRIGTCVIGKQCPSAFTELKTKGIRPTICSYNGRIPIVCCFDLSAKVEPKCPSHSKEALKISKNGGKAWDYCIDTLEFLNPCVDFESASGKSKVRLNYCQHEVIQLIINGIPAKSKEFPHMALLGFEEMDGTKRSIKWDCGGTLISDKWILTAAHCTYNRYTVSNVSRVRLGGEDQSTVAKPEHLYQVRKIVIHPEYSGLSNYNDIALLELDRKVKFSDSVIPACLHTGDSVPDEKVIAIGYGKTENHTQSDKLMKVVLDKFDQITCAQKHKVNRKLRAGITESTQICYGSNTKSVDSCQGDSGGPIQIYNNDVRCTYKIIGVTSFGRGCGQIGMPGVYTRVSAYIPWIESNVWP